MYQKLVVYETQNYNIKEIRKTFCNYKNTVLKSYYAMEYKTI